KTGASDGVRSFGQMLQQDHAAANKKAESVAQSMGMTPPTEPNSKQKADYDRLSKLSGGKFDREFVNHMVMDHKKDIKEFVPSVAAVVDNIVEGFDDPVFAGRRHRCCPGHSLAR